MHDHGVFSFLAQQLLHHLGTMGIGEALLFWSLFLVLTIDFSNYFPGWKRFKKIDFYGGYTWEIFSS